MDKHCILVVDDDLVTLEILKKTFEPLDCEVVTAQNGQEALQVCIYKQPSLIISDQQMPLLDGVGFFQQIKGSPHTKHIPFIFLTNSDNTNLKMDLLETGAEDYWHKPFNLREIVIRTKKILGQLDIPLKARQPDAALINSTPSNRVDKSTILNQKYELLETLGEGGMGIVYRSRDLTENKDVAIKVLRHENASNTVDMRRFAREAETSLRIKHPNVVATYDYGILPSGQAYIVMEILSGISLMSYLTKKISVPPVDWSIKIMHQVCLGVAAAHREGIIHRDLKTSNIFLQGDPEKSPSVKVLDFGIALLQNDFELNLNNSAERLTNPDIIIGTPQYMSPEQIQKRDFSKQMDVYSLGVIFYELLCGETPFLGSDINIMIAHINATPVPISQKIKVDSGLNDLVLRMIIKNPTERIQLDEVISLLESFGV